MTRISPDANDILVLQLNEIAGTYSNTGTAGTAGDWADYGNPVSKVPGLIKASDGSFNAVYIPGTYISPNHDGVGGANDVLATPNISLSGWVFLRRYTNYFAEIFNKQYYVDGWSNPFLTFGFQATNTNSGLVDLYITLNGTLQVISNSSRYPMPVGRWFHLGGTWDGTTLKMYINGTVVSSSNFGGVIDFNGNSARGKWYAGAVPGSGTIAAAPIIVQDVRVANIARPQSYFANIYFNGFQP